MLKPLLTFICSVAFITGFAQDIIINSISPSPVCAGSSISIDYTCTSFTPTGNLSVELSDAMGSFSTPVVIATVAAALSGVISADIPGNTSAGSGYRVRIISSAPVLTGTDNGINITIYALPPTTLLTGTGPYCLGVSCVPLSGSPAGGTYSGAGVAGATFCPSNAGVGTHTICYTYTDINGCSLADCESFVVIDNPFTVTITGTLEVTACGACNGNITASVSGGTPPYTYIWAPAGHTTAMVQNLCAGQYTVTVTDAAGCTVNATANITQPPSTVEIGINTVNDPTTCSNCDGSIITSVIGGTAPYTYLWSNGQTTANGSFLCGGQYTVTVTDANGCEDAETITLNDPAAPTLVLDSVIDINCFENNSEGLIYVHAAGGGSGYTYFLSHNLNVIATTSSPPFTDLEEGEYYVQVTDENLCSSQPYGPYIITNTSNLYVATSSTGANCDNNGTATVTAQGLYPPYTFLWDDPLAQTTATAVNLAPGGYSVTATDAIGCSRTGTAFVEQLCMNVIRGRVYLDTNENCIQDIGEYGLQSVIVHSVPGDYYAITDINGDYTLFTPEMNNTVNMPSYVLSTPTCPQSGNLTVNFNQLGDISSSNNFGYTEELNDHDLSVRVSWNASHPGFDKRYSIYYCNRSLVPMDALIRFEYDPALTYLSSTLGGVHNPALHTIEWNKEDVFPSQTWTSSQKALVDFNVPPTVSLTDILCSYFEILPLIGDIHPVDNTFSICEPVTGSHDPNAKSVIPKGIGEEGFITPDDTVLFYTIHFQNDGTDTAYTVVIKDTLSSFIDAGSIVPGGSSHPYTFSLSGQGDMIFRFDQIMLPDSNIDEPASHGYVHYTVKLKPNLPLATIIENTAHIFFDFNEAIVTNTTKNTIAEPVAIEERIVSTISVYPSPSAGTVVIESGISKGFYKINDITGKTLMQGKVTAEKFMLDVSAFSSGVYFISVTDGDKQMNGKVVKE